MCNKYTYYYSCQSIKTQTRLNKAIKKLTRQDVEAVGFKTKPLLKKFMIEYLMQFISSL